MESFPIPAPSPPTEQDLNQALLDQQALVDDIMSSLGAAIMAGLAAQQNIVAQVSGKLQRAANLSLSQQQEIVNALGVALQVAAAAATQEQQQLAQSLMSVVLPLAPITAHGSAPGPAPPGTLAGDLGSGLVAPTGPGAPPAMPHPFPSTQGGDSGGQPWTAQRPSMVPQSAGYSQQSQPTTLSPALTASLPVGAMPGGGATPSAALPALRASLPASAPAGQTPGAAIGGPAMARQGTQPAGDGSYSVSGQQPSQGTLTAYPEPGGRAPPPEQTGGVPPGQVQIQPTPGCPPTTVIVNVPPCPPTGGLPAAPAAPAAPLRPGEKAFFAPPEEPPELGGLAKTICDRIDTALKLIPPPGTHDWCVAMPLIRDGLATLGQQIIVWACKPAGVAVPELFAVQRLFSGAAETSPEWLAPILRALGDMLAVLVRAANWADQLCVCLRSLTAAAGACAPSTLVGLAAVRALFTALRTVHVGTQFPIRLTTTIGLLLPQVDRVLDYITEYACPTVIPAPGDAMQAFRQGQIDGDTLACWLLCHGCNPDVWAAVVMAGAQTLQAQQVIELSRRAGLDGAAATAALTARGWLRAEDRAGVQTLYDRLPSLGEIHQWAGRGALDDAAAARFGMDIGADVLWASPFGRALYSQGVTQEMARYSWRSHWRMPGLGEAREMLYRLRPGRAGVAKPFTEADFAALIASGDMVPALKDHLYELRYRELSPRERMALSARGLGGLGLVEDAYRAAGYSPGHAAELFALASREQQQHLDQSLYGYSPHSVTAMVRLGVMRAEDSHFWFNRWGYSPAQADQAVAGSVNQYEVKLRTRFNTLAQRRLLSNVLKAYQTGTLNHGTAQAALVRVGMQQQTASVLLATTDAAFSTQLATQAISRVKGAYLKGQVTLEQAHASLTAAGVVEPRSTQYVTSWAQELTLRERLLSASEVLKYFGEGLMTRQDAEKRLTTLGYLKADVTLKMQDAALKMLSRRAKAEQAIEKGTKAGLGTLAKLAADAQHQAAELLKETEKDAPVKTVRKFYEGGAITAEYAAELLQDYGYTPTAAERTILEWVVGGIASSEKAAQASTGGTRVGTAHRG